MQAFLDWYRGLAAWEILLCSLAAIVLLQLVVFVLLLRLVRRTRTDLDEKILLALRWPIFLSLAFFAVSYAFRRIEPRPSATFLGIADALFLSLAVLVWTRAAMRICDMVLDALARRADRFRFVDRRSLPLFDIVSRLLLVGAAAYVILLAWKVDVTAWVASAGIVGIAVGFAAKDTLANLFAGIFILADAPYKLGDFIVLDSGERGRVTDIGIRSTRLLTRDDVEITLPNAVIANAKIINETGGPHEKERVRLTIGVAYGSDIDRVREVLLEVARDCELVARHPEPRVRFREFGESALTFQLLAWIEEPVLRGRTLDALNTAVYKRFLAEGIEIPFPQRVVHLRR